MDSIYKIDGSYTESKLDSEFSKVIAARSKGEIIPKKKLYEPFRPSFLENPANNPAIANAHLSYAYDSQVRESEKYWASHGKKFGKDPRFPEDVEKSRIGPLLPGEYDHFFEKPQKVFGRNRVIRPFARAQVYTRNTDRPPAVILEEENPTVGPLSYNPYADTWSQSAKPVCGVLKPSPAFSCPSRGDLQGGLYLPEKQFLSHGKRRVPKEDESATMVSALSGSLVRPGSSAESQPRRRTGSPTIRSGQSTVAPNHQPINKGAVRNYDRNPGFTFLRGAKNKLDVHTGTTKADVVYKRARLPDGSHIVLQVSAQDEFNEGILPPGAEWEPGWGTIEHIAEEVGHLQLQATSPFMTDVRESESALVMHPSSPKPRQANGGNSTISSNKGRSKQRSPPTSPTRPRSPEFEFRLPVIQSPNNLPSSLPRHATSDKLSFGPPVYLSKKIKQLEQEKLAKELAQQQFLQSLEADGVSLGSLTYSMGADGESVAAGGDRAPHSASGSNEYIRSSGGSRAVITVPPRVADVLPYQPEKAHSQNRALASRRRSASPGLGNAPSLLAERLSPADVVMVSTLQHQHHHHHSAPILTDSLGATVGGPSRKPQAGHEKSNGRGPRSMNDSTLLSLSQTSLFVDEM